MNSNFTKWPVGLLFLLFSFYYVNVGAQSTISIASPECWSAGSAAEQNTAALGDPSNIPFATWKAVYDYAHTGGGSATVTTINFSPGYYPTDLSGFVADWGDADGGFVLKAGLTVNGNGAVIDNTGQGSSVICFATMGNNSIIDGFTFIDFTGNVSGGAISAQSATGWEVNNCNFDGCDKAGGSGMEISGGSGTLNGCNFYKHYFTTGSAMDISGGNTTLNNCTYTCNYRDNNGGRGGAIYMTGGTADFNGCSFVGNVAGGNAPGGAIAVQGSSTVANFTSTAFTCNEANTLTDQDGGAMNIEDGASVTISDCIFDGNIAKRQGGAIRSAGGSSAGNTIDLNIYGTTFTNNSTNTSPAYGGAIYLYNSTTNLDGNYLSSNSATSLGGAVYVTLNQSGNTATYTMSNNTMTSNTADNNMCTGRDVFTEMHIEGTNNQLDAVADGWLASNPTNTGSLQFNTTTASLNTSINANGYTGIPIETSFGSINYWVFNGYTASSVTGFNPGQRGMAYVLAADGSNFATANGFAVLFWRPGGTGNRKLSFVSFAGGLDDNANITVLQELGNFGSNTSGSFTCKAVNDGSTWKFYVYVSGSDITNEDPRGYNYCTPTFTVSGALAGGSTHRGIWVSNSSTANSYTYSKNYFRNTDETQGGGGSGSGLAATCDGCPSSPIAINQCPETTVGSIQGDVFLDTNMDGIMNAGEQLAGVVVNLYDSSDNLIATTTTNANGHYIFMDLPDNTYYVQFGMPVGSSSATSTTQNDGAPAFDSDIIGGVTSSTFTSPPININTSTGMSDGNDNFNNAANYYNVTAGYVELLLPVTWSSISVNNKNCQNIISWTTESETNNDYFVIESSYDGQAFGSVSMIDGQGDTRSTTKYEYNHEVKASGLMYYRIKQVDYDGKISYSPVVKSKNVSCSGVAYLTAYPNPSINDQVTLEFSEVVAGEQVHIEIINHLGQLVLSNSFDANQNMNTKVLDISTIQSGVYFIKINSTGGSLYNANVKFVKI